MGRIAFLLLAPFAEMERTYTTEHLHPATSAATAPAVLASGQVGPLATELPLQQRGRHP
jgi:hypothetical protein